MTGAERLAAAWWRARPAYPVSQLDADPELLRITLDPLPPDAPAVLQFRAADRAGDPIGELLDELERAAVRLFPSWLPGAERLDASLGVAVPAVRALAARTAARSRDFGPFLVALAEQAVADRVAALAAGRAGRPPAERVPGAGVTVAPAGAARGPARFPAEVRAAGLVRVIARAYGREAVALLVEVPDGLSPEGERCLVAAVEWLAQQGPLTGWLAGAPLRVVDRVPWLRVTLPGEVIRSAEEPPADPAPVGAPEPVGPPAPVGAPEPVAGLTCPPVAGSPRADSDAELALERALAPYEWAAGRQWNQTYEWHLLGRPYRLDLFWPAEGLVVEVDGPEHRGRLKYADDRRRDGQLQRLGYAVLRFTNEEVCSDVQSVVSTIGEVLQQRRVHEAPTTHAPHVP